MSKSKLALSCAVFACALAIGSPASALVTFTSTPGGATYTGPTPTYDFDTTTPTLNPAPGPGYGVVTNDPGTHALPLGGSGQFLSAGPSTSEPQTVLLNGLGDIFNLSFIWGSVDTYNHITFTDALGNPLGAGYSFSGADVAIPANGNQTADNTNPLVTFFFSGGDQTLVRGFQLTSEGTNAFEIDDIAVNGVPEPATWAMMLLGFGAVGVSMRRRKLTLPQLA